MQSLQDLGFKQLPHPTDSPDPGPCSIASLKIVFPVLYWASLQPPQTFLLVLFYQWRELAAAVFRSWLSPMESAFLVRGEGFEGLIDSCMIFCQNLSFNFILEDQSKNFLNFPRTSVSYTNCSLKRDSMSLILINICIIYTDTSYISFSINRKRT